MTFNIDILGLNKILKDDKARAFYNSGVHNGIKMTIINDFNIWDTLQRHNLTLIKNHILERKKNVLKPL
jgi:hypothetical protein